MVNFPQLSLRFNSYTSLLEGVTGTTIGKKTLNMKVVREDGSSCEMGPSFVRSILRADAFPYFKPYAIACILSIRTSTKKQRSGDLVVHRVVVVSSDPVKLSQDLNSTVSPDSEKTMKVDSERMKTHGAK
jgi:uncharacterized RDD family membrane protein YckC